MLHMSLDEPPLLKMTTHLTPIYSKLQEGVSKLRYCSIQHNKVLNIHYRCDPCRNQAHSSNPLRTPGTTEERATYRVERESSEPRRRGTLSLFQFIAALLKDTGTRQFIDQSMKRSTLKGQAVRLTTTSEVVHRVRTMSSTNTWQE